MAHHMIRRMKYLCAIVGPMFVVELCFAVARTWNQLHDKGNQRRRLWAASFRTRRKGCFDSTHAWKFEFILSTCRDFFGCAWSVESQKVKPWKPLLGVLNKVWSVFYVGEMLPLRLSDNHVECANLVVVDRWKYHWVNMNGSSAHVWRVPRVWRDRRLDVSSSNVTSRHTLRLNAHGSSMVKHVCPRALRTTLSAVSWFYVANLAPLV